MRGPTAPRAARGDSGAPLHAGEHQPSAAAKAEWRSGDVAVFGPETPHLVRVAESGRWHPAGAR
jgi:hypothetical protein